MKSLSTALRFVALQALDSLMSERCMSPGDIFELKAKIARYEAKSKEWRVAGKEDIWGDDARRYRRDLKEALRERKLWLAAKAELKGKPKAKRKAVKP